MLWNEQSVFTNIIFLLWRPFANEISGNFPKKNNIFSFSHVTKRKSLRQKEVTNY